MISGFFKRKNPPTNAFFMKKNSAFLYQVFSEVPPSRPFMLDQKFKI
jgi:hypothetical protein